MLLLLELADCRSGSKSKMPVERVVYVSELKGCMRYVRVSCCRVGFVGWMKLRTATRRAPPEIKKKQIRRHAAWLIGSRSLALASATTNLRASHCK